MMNKVIKGKWLKALRSGDYTQGIGHLKDGRKGGRNTTYCCLGVLMDIQGHSLDKKSSSRRLDDGEYDEYPSDVVLKEVGLRKRTADALAVINDDSYDFKHTTSYISKNL